MKSIEMITIKEVDTDMYIHDSSVVGDACFTNNIKSILAFKDEYDAEEFCKLYLDEDCYEIIKLKINIGMDEKVLKTINF